MLEASKAKIGHRQEEKSATNITELTIQDQLRKCETVGRQTSRRNRSLERRTLTVVEPRLTALPANGGEVREYLGQPRQRMLVAVGCGRQIGAAFVNQA